MDPQSDHRSDVITLGRPHRGTRAIQQTHRYGGAPTAPRRYVMNAIVQLFDETPSGTRTPAIRLRLASESLTARELIERRVEAEVKRHNKRASQPFRGLVQPTDDERRLNKPRRGGRLVDAASQVQIAIAAFENNGFFLLVDDQQVTSLEQRIVLTEETQISFIKLVALVGG